MGLGGAPEILPSQRAAGFRIERSQSPRRRFRISGDERRIPVGLTFEAPGDRVVAREYQ